MTQNAPPQTPQRANPGIKYRESMSRRRQRVILGHQRKEPTIMTPPEAKPSRWRDVYPVHPCTDVFPMMADDDIKELAEDIQNHGVQKPIVVWRSGPDQPWQVLDGRNRLEALSRLGVDLPQMSNGTAPEIQVPNGDIVRDVFIFKHNVSDPAAFVISANIHRRHLTKEQRAELIFRTIEAAQTKDDRAQVARSFSPTAGKKGGSTKDPVLEQAVAQGKQYGISKRTVQNARAKVHGKVRSPLRMRSHRARATWMPRPAPKHNEGTRTMPSASR